MPFQPKTNSTNTAPASSEANQPLTAVSTASGVAQAVTQHHLPLAEAPWPCAVRMWSWASTSSRLLRVSCTMMASGRTPA